jgi:hypothetical protein
MPDVGHKVADPERRIRGGVVEWVDPWFGKRTAGRHETRIAMKPFQVRVLT